MERRDFLRTTLAAGLVATTGGIETGCRRAERNAAPAPTPASTTPPTALELAELTIADLRAGLEAGRWTARALTAAYLGRIEELDRKGPALHSMIELNPNAIAIAAELDAERQAKGGRGPLHGIPILLKDNIDTADRMTTTAGSLALAGSVPARDAAVAARLRAAGAVLLGKANLSEWANIRSPHSSSGWSARGGQCKNPYALDRNPCGSSSGSAVAVAANLAAAAIGTETDGSIVCPANTCGIVGLKPTVGLVSRRGVIPIAHTQDTAGPMTRTVRDAALLLGVLAGVDPEDPATGAAKRQAPSDYTQFLDAGGLSNARLGVARQYGGFHREVDRLFAQALDVLKKHGAVLVDPVELTSDSEIGEAELTVLLYELKADLNTYLKSLGPTAPVKSLAEVIAFNEKNAEREMPYFGQEFFAQAQAKGPLSAPEYRAALAKCGDLARTKGIDAVMAKHRLDAIVAPTGGPAWVTDLVNGDHFSGGSSTLPAVAGYPNITVPAGFIRGLPVGISFFGRAWSEPVLLRLAFAFEQATQHRRPPHFLATVEL